MCILLSCLVRHTTLLLSDLPFITFSLFQILSSLDPLLYNATCIGVGRRVQARVCKSEVNECNNRPNCSDQIFHRRYIHVHRAIQTSSRPTEL